MLITNISNPTVEGFLEKSPYFVKTPLFAVNWGSTRVDTRFFDPFCKRVLNEPAAVSRAVDKKWIWSYNSRLHTDFFSVDLLDSTYQTPEMFASIVGKQMALHDIAFTKQPLLTQQYKVLRRKHRDAFKRSVMAFSDGSGGLVERAFRMSSQGRGLSFNFYEKDLLKGRYLQPYVPTEVQLRLHVFKRPDGSLYLFLQDPFRGPDLDKEIRKSGSYKDLPVNSVKMVQVDKKHPVCTPEVLKIFRDSGLDFCAMDLGIIKGTEKVFCFELNTAPGLGAWNRNLYTDVFDDIVLNLE